MGDVPTEENVQITSIADILHKESLKCDAYIYKGGEFQWLDYVNDKYFEPQWDKESVYNTALDIHNYYKRNGVLHDAKRMALMNTFRFMLEEATPYEDEL